MNRIAFLEELYGQPERAVPYLCLGAGLAVGLLTRSPGFGVVTWGVSALLWNHWSPKLVIDDLRLGPIQLTCPSHNDEGRPQVWLTFDDGPGPETLEIVELLNEAGLSATFFFIGRCVRSFQDLPELRQALSVGGHSVANHTLTHPNLLRLRSSELRQELEENQRLLEEHFEELVLPMFRPPFGYRNESVLQCVEELKLTTVGWSCNSLDFLQGPTERVVQRVEKGLEAGTVLLFHDGEEKRRRTVEAMPTIIRRIQELGFGAYSPT